MIRPTDMPYIRPGETVGFQLSTDADETATFQLDFRDGNSHSTLDHYVSYAWADEGTYNVEITATTRTSSEVIYSQVREAMSAISCLSNEYNIYHIMSAMHWQMRAHTMSSSGRRGSVYYKLSVK